MEYSKFVKNIWNLKYLGFDIYKDYSSKYIIVKKFNVNKPILQIYPNFDNVIRVRFFILIA